MSCGGGTTNPEVMGQVPVPTGSSGNGVIFVQNVSGSTCVAGGNPFDDSAESSTGYPNAQITSTYNLTDDIYQGAGGQDCEGDAFVRNANGTEDRELGRWEAA